MLEAARFAVRYVEGRSLEGFSEDVQLQDAVIRRLGIVGEAARRVSESTRSDYPAIDWNEMVGMRNFLVHQYGDVDTAIVWDTVQSDLPPLISLLAELFHSDSTGSK